MLTPTPYPVKPFDAMAGAFASPRAHASFTAVAAVYDRVLRFIADPLAEPFESLALAVFTHQFESVPAYREHCKARGCTPETVTSWQRVPPVPIVAFKHAPLCCGPAIRTFRSSGTTAGSLRAEHAVPDLRLYHRSAVAGLRRFLFPDQPRMRLLSLVPTAEAAPDSSLAQMVDWAFAAFAADGSTYATDVKSLRTEVCLDTLRAAERDGTPLAVLTTTAALLRLIEHCRATGHSFRLPHGSRLMDTGGDKGTARPLSRNGLLHAIWHTFAVPGYFVVNEYGMAELSSQYYDSVLADRLAGHHRARRKLAPHWARLRALDPESLTPAAPGAPGLLCHYDLANAGSIMAILSEDIGVLDGDGFQLLGRAPRAEPRGCSLAAPSWLAA